MKIKFVIILIFLILLTSCGFDDFCQDYTVSEVSSDEYTATFFTRGCGATTSDYPYINIRKKGEDLEFSSFRKKQVILPINTEENKIYWKDNSTLIIDCKYCLKDGIDNANSKTKNLFGGIKIEYAINH